MPTDENEKDVVTRPKRNPNKKSYWGDKPDKLLHHEKASFKNKVQELVDEDDENDINFYK
jgi:hypothetical protein